MAGMVYLVGAGPGDYRLLTLKACDCLKEAQVIVYDRLADERILRFASSEAELIYVGKASSHHTMKQEDISRLLVEKAQAGKCVVRLKGGDPFVFGRGGEEAELLSQNNLPFEIVPGVTSAISVPAYAGIPVTQRHVAASFAVVTGHEDPAKEESDIHWDKLATAVDTLVFLMGVANLPRITAQLIANGRVPETPAAVISWGTKPQQETLVTTVGKAAADVAEAGIKPPAVFIVGDVVNMRRQLAWFDKKETHPLHGRTVLVTRARTQASRLVLLLEKLGASCKEVPTICFAEPADDYKALDEALAHLQEYDWLIFTSANGVKSFMTRIFASGRDVRALGLVKCVAIGVATGQKLREYGIVADLIPAEYRAEGILEAIRPHLQPGMRILLPRAEKAREVLPEGLRAMGAEVHVVPAYATQMDKSCLEEDLMSGGLDWVTFTSSSTVENFCSAAGEKKLPAGTKIACIGPVTAATCRRHGLEPDVVAEDYTIDGLVEAICKGDACQC